MQAPLNLLKIPQSLTLSSFGKIAEMGEYFSPKVLATFPKGLERQRARRDEPVGNP